MSNAELIWDLVDGHREDFIGLADRIWGMPEIAYTEYRSVEEHRKMLEQYGFKITEDVGGIPTAADRLLGTRFGVAAIDAIVSGESHKFTALSGEDITLKDFSVMSGKTKWVPEELLQAASGL